MDFDFSPVWSGWREVADEVAVMDHGVLLESGPPEQIFDKPEHARTREFLQAVLTRA